MNALNFPGRKKARIEIIPLIDVVFFLLATFVLFTLSLDRIGGLPVKLPVVPITPPVPQEATLFLQATDGGAVYWKLGDHGASELITRAELPARLHAYVQQTGNPRVLVRGDGKSKFGDAVAIFDQVRLAGIDQVSIETLVSRSGN